MQLNLFGDLTNATKKGDETFKFLFAAEDYIKRHEKGEYGSLERSQWNLANTLASGFYRYKLKQGFNKIQNLEQNHAHYIR